MEARIRRYFTFAKLGSKPLPSTVLKEEMTLMGIPYEKNPPARSSIFSRSSWRKTPDDVDALDAPPSTIATSRYESTTAGSPPVFGSTPLKGNGPVKLQTSRRLSSGELLTTTQEHDRTLADIRDGQYIVGGKETKRQSKPLLNPTPPIHQENPSSPRASLRSAPPSSFSHRPSSPPLGRRGSSTQTPGSPTRSPSFTAHPPHISQSPTRIRKERPPSLKRSPVSESPDVPLSSSRASPPLSAKSLLSRGEEQNATVQALWKAEYARLVSIYGQDGVDRNIAQLNKDDFAHVFEERPKSPPVEEDTSVAGATSLTPSTDTIVPSRSQNPRASMQHVSPPADTTSDESSVRISSALSSQRSSHTQHTSIYDSEIPTTREEVSRIVENMRKNYLTALEAKSDKMAAEPRARPTQRSSYNYPSATTHSTTAASSRLGRQSWHASTTAGNNKQDKLEKQSRRRTRSRPKTLRDASIGSPEMTTPKSKSRPKPVLQRADSTTLGSLFGMKKAERISVEKSPSLTQTPANHEVPVRPVSPTPSIEILAPDSDDFDIFYRDLTLEFDSFSRYSKPAVTPTIHLPHGQCISPEPDDGASPPPDIDWMPRKDSLVEIM